MKLVSAVLLLLAPLLTSCMSVVLPLDCSDIFNRDKSLRSGVYTIYPIRTMSAVGLHFKPSGIKVFCDLESEGGRWTVFQRRMDGTVNFYRPWDQYRMGFGYSEGEYWFGLENLYQLTRQRKYELLVDMEDFEGNKVFARYTSFSIDAECHGYKLHVSGFINGGAGNALSSHNGQKFSTFDKDQDAWPKSCARQFLGAFWYNKCHQTNPNGVYRWGADGTVFAVGVEWYPWKNHDYSLKTISMKVRPVH